MDSSALLAFIVAALIVLLLPGPGVLYVVTRSLTQGKRAGMVSVFGLAAGAFIHVIAGAVGLSALLLASATAFSVVKILGVCYLLYLGIRALMTRSSAPGTVTVARQSYWRMFTEGVLISALNPKIAAFFVAFLPQFISPEQGPIPLQFLSLGLLYVALAICTDGAYALFAATVRARLKPSLLAGKIPRYLSGFTYLGLGIGLALTDRRVTS